MKRTELKRGGSLPRNRKPASEQRFCRYCGKVFEFKLSQLNAYKGGGQYCSRPCSYAGQVKRNARKPITDKYGRSGRKADKEWREAVRERDNFTCRRCGKYDPYIHAHHVATRSRRPDLKHDVDNGICLDGTCHQWVHHNPVEAERLGFLVESRYELERLAERVTNAGRANRVQLDEARVVALHRGGMRAKAIARELGVGEGPVFRVLREHGCPPHPCGNPNRRPA